LPLALCLREAQYAPMDIQLASERLFLIEDRLTADEAQQLAVERRLQAFGSGLGSLLQRPKAEDIVLVARQRRLEPFWHVVATAHYHYERRRDYNVPTSAPEVEAVTIEGTRHEASGPSGAPRTFRMPALEHCHDEFRHEIYSDGISGEPISDPTALLAGPRSEIADPASLGGGDAVVVPPEQRASFVVRTALAAVMKPVQADRILEESVGLEATDLYYRAYWAFEFAWQAKGKQGVVEVDAITGKARPGKPLLSQIKGMVTRDLLFDVGADTVGLLVPGGSIAVRLAQAAIDRK
jgi:hypothetical protein